MDPFRQALADAAATGLLHAALAVTFAVLVIVPLGLERLDAGAPRRCSRRLLLAAGAPAVLSLLLPAGWVTALLALPWLALVSWLACHGAVAGARGVAERRLSGYLEGAALVHLPVAAGALVWARSGRVPAPFAEPIMTLAAVHFHYAGFAVLAFLALLARQGIGRELAALCAVLSIATAIVGVGFLVSPLVEVCGALLLTGGLVAVAVAVALRLRSCASLRTQLLLAAAAASLLVAMPLGAWYAVCLYREVSTPAIPFMAATHGLLNALGFACCGLLGMGGRERVSGSRS